MSVAVVMAAASLLLPSSATAQEAGSERDLHWLPDRDLLPTPTTGPRDPVSKAELLYVSENPTQFGAGMEAEFALAALFPLLRWGEAETAQVGRKDWVVGVEAAAFARFGLHRTERELVNTDWFFTIPLVRWMGPHWARVRYYHTSSHLGDEYARRFEAESVNFARDAVDALGWFQAAERLGIYAGAGWAFNVHPEDSKRSWLRLGLEWGAPGPASTPTTGWRPFAAADVNLEQDVGWSPRWSGQVGLQAPPMPGGSIRVFLGVLSGPTPLGQFQGGRTRHVSLGLSYAP